MSRARQQSRPLENCKVPGKRRGFSGQSLGDCQGGDAVRDLLHEELEHRQSGRVRECRKCVDCRVLVHNSSMPELSKLDQRLMIP